MPWMNGVSSACRAIGSQERHITQKRESGGGGAVDRLCLTRISSVRTIRRGFLMGRPLSESCAAQCRSRWIALLEPIRVPEVKPREHRELPRDAGSSPEKRTVASPSPAWAGVRMGEGDRGGEGPGRRDEKKRLGGEEAAGSASRRQRRLRVRQL